MADTNEPAFPQLDCFITDRGERCVTTHGMTLRQWYAGLAMQGFCANPAVFASNPRSGWGLVNCTDDQLADRCVELADAVIKAFKEPTTRDTCRPGVENAQIAQLLGEAAMIIRRLPPDVFDSLQVRHFICDELEGAAIMLREAARLPGGQESQS